MPRPASSSLVIKYPHWALLGVLLLAAGLLFAATREPRQRPAEPDGTAPVVEDLRSEAAPPIPESTVEVEPMPATPVPLPPTRQTYRDPLGRFQIDYPTDYIYYSAPFEGAVSDEQGFAFDPTQPDRVGFVSERWRKNDGLGFSYISIEVDPTDYQTEPIMVYLKTNNPCPGQLLTFPNTPQPVCYQENLGDLVPQMYAWSDGNHTYLLSVITGIPPETIHWMMWSFRLLPQK